MSNRVISDFGKVKKSPHVRTQNKQKDVEIPKPRDVKLDVKPCTSEAEYDKDMALLKDFDLNWEYGPCTGISRISRWERAEKFGLKPPGEVRDLLLRHPDDDDYTKSLWKDYSL